MIQLPLPFAAAPRYDPADYIEAPSNEAARRWLQSPEGWTNGRLIIWGDPGCGKSFLAQIWAQKAGAGFLHGPSLTSFDTAPLGLLAIDDADRAAIPATLLHLLNAAAESGHKVLMTMAAPPNSLPGTLADLQSRLRAATIVEIAPPEDALRDALLANLAAARQLHLSRAVRGFLLTHLPRTTAALREAVFRLDEQALAHGGKITRQLAADVCKVIHNSHHGL